MRYGILDQLRDRQLPPSILFPIRLNMKYASPGLTIAMYVILAFFLLIMLVCVTKSIT